MEPDHLEQARIITAFSTNWRYSSSESRPSGFFALTLIQAEYCVKKSGNLFQVNKKRTLTLIAEGFLPILADSIQTMSVTFRKDIWI